MRDVIMTFALLSIGVTFLMGCDTMLTAAACSKEVGNQGDCGLYRAKRLVKKSHAYKDWEQEINEAGRENHAAIMATYPKIGNISGVWCKFFPKKKLGLRDLRGASISN